MKRTRPWEVNDAVGERVQPLIPARPPHPKGGRPAENDRQMFSAILYVLRTGIQWNALPGELGASTTVYDRFRLWEKQGFLTQLWQAGLHEYDELEGIPVGMAEPGWSDDQGPDRAEPRPEPIPPIAANAGRNAVRYVMGMDYRWRLRWRGPMCMIPGWLPRPWMLL